MPFGVLDPTRNFRGRSYGDWAAEWSNFLLSADPDRVNDDGAMLFLRGNLDYYKYLLCECPQGDPERNLAQQFYNRTADEAAVIQEGTAVLIPVLTTTHIIGEQVEGVVLSTEGQLRAAARKENDLSGGIFCLIQEFGSKWQSVVDDLLAFRTETPLYKLTVAADNPFIKYISAISPISEGEYDAVTDCIIVIVMLKAGSYRIQFGGKGRGKYRSVAIYDIHVTSRDRSRNLLKDISSGNDANTLWFNNRTAQIPSFDLSELQKFQ
jgi:hypothetical protein